MAIRAAPMFWLLRITPLRVLVDKFLGGRTVSIFLVIYLEMEFLGLITVLNAYC